MLEINESLYLLYLVSMTNNHILTPMQKRIDNYLTKKLGVSFKTNKYKLKESLDER